MLAPRDTLDRAVRKNLIRSAAARTGVFLQLLRPADVGFAALTMNHDLRLINAGFGGASGAFFHGHRLLAAPNNLAP